MSMQSGPNRAQNPANYLSFNATNPLTLKAHDKFNAPQALAYCAAVLLALASAVTNVSSAIAKQPDMAGKFIAGSIALAVAALVLIALPAALASLRDRQYTNAALAGLAFTLAASFSISAALGTLGKPRLEAGMHAEYDGKARARLDAERNSVLAELATLAPARNAAELNSLIAAKLATPGANGCAKTDGPISTRACSEAASLQSEASRFERISALSGTVARIDGQMSAIGKPGIANGDAAALVAVLAVFGIAIDANAVNVGLMCLATAILELGSGLSLALAQSLRVAAPILGRDVVVTAAPLPAAVALPAIEQIALADTSPSVSKAAARIAELARKSGGSLQAASQRALAREIAVNPGSVNRALAFLVSTGAAVVALDHGVSVALVAA